MPFRLKLGLCILMGFGLIAAICAIIKTVLLTTISHTEDISYYLARLAITTATEQWIILIVGCIPPLRPLLKSVFNKVRSSNSASRSGAYPGQGPTPYNNNHKPYPSTYGKSALPSSRHLSNPRETMYGMKHANTTTRAYHSDIFELQDQHHDGRSRSDSKESIVKEPEGIVMTTHVDVRFENSEGEEVNHHHGKAERSRSIEDGDEGSEGGEANVGRMATVSDRV
ncbi:putative integral membrane protein [Phaeomoniella chlamydospora]|uniref:Putative integral membrane protein n=1 Tax=Phaeomoniella chlamydospora TaxID=158046 RepID=A0A0G2EXC9_PHACM|nr:putative integral membrane protein [Phaeomoniella chlamydospora]